MGVKTIAICTASVPFFHGGAERLAEDLNEELKKRGFESTIVQIPFKWYPKNEILKHALMWRLIDLSESNGKKIDLVISLKFPSYLVEHHNKVVYLLHQFRQVYDLLGTKYSDFANTEEDINIVNTLRNIDKRFLGNAKKVFTNSKNTAQRLKTYNNIEGIPLHHPPRNADRFRCDSYEDYIFTAGRLDPIKRNDLLIMSMRYTKKPLKCLVAGVGPDERRLKLLAEEYGVSDRVTFLGYIDDKRLVDIYARAMAVYYAPYDEDYGLVSMESFLSKKPVITTCDSGGVLEFMEHGVNGYILDANPKEIGEHINEMYSDRSKCKALGEKGYEKAKIISWDSVVENLIN